MTTKASSAITQRLLEFAKSQPTVKYHNANSIEIEQCVFCSSNLVEEDHGEYSPCLHVEAMTNKEPSAVEHDEAWLIHNKSNHKAPEGYPCSFNRENMRSFAKQYAEHLTAKLQAENDALREALQTVERHKEVYKVFSHEHLMANVGTGTLLELIEIRADQIGVNPHPLLEQSS